MRSREILAESHLPCKMRAIPFRPVLIHDYARQMVFEALWDQICSIPFKEFAVKFKGFMTIFKWFVVKFKGHLANGKGVGSAFQVFVEPFKGSSVRFKWSGKTGKCFVVPFKGHNVTLKDRRPPCKWKRRIRTWQRRASAVATGGGTTALQPPSHPVAMSLAGRRFHWHHRKQRPDGEPFRLTPVFGG
jgi:hypothetical protein